MLDCADYRISSNGGVLPDFDTADVADAFAELFGVPQEKARAYIDKRKLIKKNLTSEEAEAYGRKLQNIGIPVTVVSASMESGLMEQIPTQLGESAGNSVSGSAASVSRKAAPVATVAAVDNELAGLSLVPTDSDEQVAAAASTGNGMSVEQHTHKRPETQTVATGVERESADHAEAIKRSAARVPSDTDSSNVVLVLLLPVITALVGAIVWKMIAISFGYELGLVAWALGAAVGVAAAYAGGRGNGVGMTCGMLALFAILGGKYLTMTNFQDDMAAMLIGDASDMAEYYDDYYAMIEAEANEFDSISKDDASLKKFIFKHEYTVAQSADTVSREDLEDFRELTQPVLEQQIAGTLVREEYSAETSPQLAAALDGSTSTWSLVFASMKKLDFIFLFLGVATAFRLGRQGLA